MQNVNNSPFCLYRYDPLNRLCDCTLLGQESARRFYQKDRLATEISGAVQHSIIPHADQLLAQQQRQSDTVETSLLATDQQRSVLNVLTASTPQPITHTPYGHRPLASGLLSLLGFNGERPDPVTGCYLLGNGYRAFNPVLMRFNSPDSWSPFGKGGLNAYAYCRGDPVNRVDPTAHAPKWIRGMIPKHWRPKTRAISRPTTSGSNSSVSNPLLDQSAQEIINLRATVASQQRTIESLQTTNAAQQRTITSMQEHNAALYEVIRDGRSVVHGYQETAVQMRSALSTRSQQVAFLQDELNFHMSLLQRNTPELLIQSPQSINETLHHIANARQARDAQITSGGLSAHNTEIRQHPT